MKKGLNLLDSPEVLVLLSGGLDSAVCLDIFLKLGRPTCGLFVDYGQLAVEQERRAARAIAAHYSVNLLTASWHGVTQKAMGLIPGRNGFLIMAGLMERPLSVTGMALGIHAGTSYADCSQNFLCLMQDLVKFYSDNAVEVLAPLIDWGKVDVFNYCDKHNVPVSLTYSCERGGEEPCGQCLSCKDKELLNASS